MVWVGLYDIKAGTNKNEYKLDIKLKMKGERLIFSYIPLKGVCLWVF